MKKLIYILILILISLVNSCKKERLKDEKVIFIGEWDLKYTIKDEWRNGNARKIDTIFPSDSPTTLTLKKNGKVFLVLNGEEEKYKMNFKRDGARFSSELSDVWFVRDTGSVFFSEKQHSFAANFHNGIGTENKVRVMGSVGENWLIIVNSSSKIISEYGSGGRMTIYNNFFKRVN